MLTCARVVAPRLGFNALVLLVRFGPWLVRPSQVLVGVAMVLCANKGRLAFGFRWPLLLFGTFNTLATFALEWCVTPHVAVLTTSCVACRLWLVVSPLVRSFLRLVLRFYTPGAWWFLSFLERASCNLWGLAFLLRLKTPFYCIITAFLYVLSFYSWPLGLACSSLWFFSWGDLGLFSSSSC